MNINKVNKLELDKINQSLTKLIHHLLRIKYMRN